MYKSSHTLSFILVSPKTVTSDTMIDELGAVLGKYEVPLGLINKLMMLVR